MRKVWDFMERINHSHTYKEFQTANARLDEYLEELARTELNLDADELENFATALSACNNEIERNLLLKKEIETRKIDLPFEIGSDDSARQWLLNIAKKI